MKEFYIVLFNKEAIMAAALKKNLPANPSLADDQALPPTESEIIDTNIGSDFEVSHLYSDETTGTLDEKSWYENGFPDPLSIRTQQRSNNPLSNIIWFWHNHLIDGWNHAIDRKDLNTYEDIDIIADEERKMRIVEGISDEQLNKLDEILEHKITRSIAQETPLNGEAEEREILERRFHPDDLELKKIIKKIDSQDIKPPDKNPHFSFFTKSKMERLLKKSEDTAKPAQIHKPKVIVLRPERPPVKKQKKGISGFRLAFYFVLYCVLCVALGAEYGQELRGFLETISTTAQTPAPIVETVSCQYFDPLYSGRTKVPFIGTNGKYEGWYMLICNGLKAIGNPDKSPKDGKTWDKADVLIEQ